MRNLYSPHPAEISRIDINHDPYPPLVPILLHKKPRQQLVFPKPHFYSTAISNAGPGYPSMAGYSQSRSRPSIWYCLNKDTADLAKLLRCSADANSPEQRAQPPQPPMETMILR